MLVRDLSLRLAGVGGMKVRAILGAALAVGLGVGVAGAAPAPPATIDDAGVTAWLKAHIKSEGWTLIAADGAAVVLGSPDGVSHAADATLTTQVRHEYYSAVRLGELDSRSNLQTWNVDCKGKRIRIVSMAIFEENNLYGKSQSVARPDAGWTAIDPTSTRARTIKRICEAPTTGQRLK